MENMETNKVLSRHELCYKLGMSVDDFIEEIDKTGGWPEGYKYVMFYHGVNRCCQFTNDGTNTDWWTLALHSDEYYFSKLTSSFKEKLKKDTIRNFLTELKRSY
jgi:hypothetical protein